VLVVSGMIVTLLSSLFSVYKLRIAVRERVQRLRAAGVKPTVKRMVFVERALTNHSKQMLLSLEDRAGSLGETRPGSDESIAREVRDLQRQLKHVQEQQQQELEQKLQQQQHFLEQRFQQQQQHRQEIQELMLQIQQQQHFLEQRLQQQQQQHRQEIQELMLQIQQQQQLLEHKLQQQQQQHRKETQQELMLLLQQHLKH
jgi:isoleucyl-tRNA synthetase